MNMRVDVVTAEVVEALHAGGIPSILLKGPATVRLLYRDEPPRPYVDVDLLVPPPEASAVAVLRRLGFGQAADGVPRDWHGHGVSWIRERDGASVDLHRSYFGIGVDEEGAWKVLSGRTERIPVGGADVEVLPVSGQALVIALHAASHGLRWTKSQQDLARAIRRLSLSTWQAAARLADQLQATPAFASGLRLLPEGQHLAERLRLATRSSVGLAIRTSGGPPAALFIERLATLPGVRAKLAFAVRKLFPPRSWVRDWAVRQPRRPSNLALAYIWRLGSFARIAPSAFRAWTRSRRQQRQEL